MHGAVRTLAALVFLECRQDVPRVLAHEFRHAVGRVDVLVILNAMTAQAGVGDLLAVGGISCAARLCAQTQGEEYKKDKQQISDLQQQISTLEQQTNASKTENDQLKAEIAKVQAEQSNLAVQNEILSKAIATYKSTGRMPDYKLPYPPK